MKTLKKSLILSSLLMGVMGSVPVMANLASNTFVWSGNVPPAVTATTFIITDNAGNPLLNSSSGLLQFQTDSNGDVMLSGSTPIEFNVYKYDATTSQVDLTSPATVYEYKLVSLKTAAGGGYLQEQSTSSGYYKLVDGSNQTVVKNNSNTVNGGGLTSLKVEQDTSSPNPTNAPQPGDAVSLHAAIIIESATA